MFWILRRTGAVNFFNSINNNNGATKTNLQNNNNSERNPPRPARKAYGRLSVESDDNSSIRCDLNHQPLVDLELDNHPFSNRERLAAREELAEEDDDDDDDQPNIDETDSDLELDRTIKRNRRLDDNTITRLQAMAISDDEEYDESLTCNVCDRAFHSHRQLASHQQKKRHFGCSGCDSLFPSLMLLEHHKEEFEHWSDGEEESRRLPCCRRRHRGGGAGGSGGGGVGDGGEEFFTDTDTATSDAESEDLERLL